MTKQDGREAWMLRNGGHGLCQIAFLPHPLPFSTKCSPPGARPVRVISTSSHAVWLLFELNKRKALAGIGRREGNEMRRFLSGFSGEFTLACWYGSTQLHSLVLPLFLVCRMVTALLLPASVSFSVFVLSSHLLGYW